MPAVLSEMALSDVPVGAFTAQNRRKRIIPAMQRRKLPIGMQTFAKIRGDDYYYVDKTPLALRLIESGSHDFLSRPRRFGKSLFLDTLAELFAGNEPLFRGLYCHDRWDWSMSTTNRSSTT
jgi:hypothetical protein